MCLPHVPPGVKYARVCVHSPTVRISTTSIQVPSIGISQGSECLHRRSMQGFIDGGFQLMCACVCGTFPKPRIWDEGFRKLSFFCPGPGFVLFKFEMFFSLARCCITGSGKLLGRRSDLGFVLHLHSNIAQDGRCWSPSGMSEPRCSSPLPLHVIRYLLSCRSSTWHALDTMACRSTLRFILAKSYYVPRYVQVIPFHRLPFGIAVCGITSRILY